MGNHHPENDHPGNDDDDRYVYGQVVHQVVVTIDEMGTMTRNLRVCDYMIDTETNKLIQIGGEDELQDSDIDFIQEALTLTSEEIQKRAAQAAGRDDGSA